MAKVIKINLCIFVALLIIGAWWYNKTIERQRKYELLTQIKRDMEHAIDGFDEYCNTVKKNYTKEFGKSIKNIDQAIEEIDELYPIDINTESEKIIDSHYSSNKKDNNDYKTNAKPLQYFYDAQKNSNEWKRMWGKTYLLSAIVNNVSERTQQYNDRNDTVPKYLITFGESQLKEYPGNVFGLSTDCRFEYLHLPTRVTMKVTIKEDTRYWFNVLFTDLEIVQ